MVDVGAVLCVLATCVATLRARVMAVSRRRGDGIIIGECVSPPSPYVLVSLSIFDGYGLEAGNAPGGVQQL